MLEAHQSLEQSLETHLLLQNLMPTHGSDKDVATISVQPLYTALWLPQWNVTRLLLEYIVALHPELCEDMGTLGKDVGQKMDVLDNVTPQHGVDLEIEASHQILFIDHYGARIKLLEPLFYLLIEISHESCRQDPT